mmetsp:Transcript_115382/g.359348  ORF Transcript_115382/g.359348 Transcript_115382/m.359348 type:complete len:139 (+) Transcript_115382:355-771(+)
MSPSEALKDCEKCIELAPDFAKGYTRRGAAYMLMREYEKATSSYEHALSLDANNADALDGVQRCNQAIRRNEENLTTEERQAKAMKDPEVQAILSDPVMSMILQEMTNDPRAAADHMKNPEIAKKIQKLVNAGVIRTR